MLQKSRNFGWGKTTIGITSAALGALFLVNDNSTAHAATTDAQPQDQVVQNNPVTNKEEANTPKAETLKVKKSPVLSVKEDTSKHDTYQLTEAQKQIWKNYQLPKLTDSQVNELENIYYFNTPDFSADRLKEMGLDADTYLVKGVKSKLYSDFSITFEPMDHPELAKTLISGKFHENHAKNGNGIFVDAIQHNTIGPVDSEDNFNKLFDFMEKYLNLPKGIAITPTVNTFTKIAPLLNGGTLYINKGDQFTPEDTKRGFDKSLVAGFKTVKYNDEINRQNNVDTKSFNQTPGTYQVAITATYKNDAAVSGGVTVIVVELKGKTVTVNVGDKVATKPEDYITGAPAGSKMVWSGATPSSATAGSFELPVEVTYPDGSKGHATATLIVKSVNKPDDNQNPDKTPDPEPNPTPQPLPEPEPDQPTDDQDNDIPKPLPTKEPEAPATSQKTTNHEAVRPLAAAGEKHPVIAKAQEKVAHVLPQTGSKNNVLMTVIGGILVSLVALWLMASDKRKD